MKRTKQLPPPAVEPWNTTATPDPEPIAEPEPIDSEPSEHNHRVTAAPSDAPTVEMPAVPTDPATLLEPTAPAAPPQPPTRRSSFRGAAIAGGGLAAVLIIAAVSLVMLLGGGSESGDKPIAIAPDPPSSSAPAPAAPVDPNADCPSATTGPVSTGRDAGDFTTGAGVIKKYDYAFYIARSGVDARATGAPTANMGTAQAIQASIDATPVGTKHCLSITDRGNGLFDVTLTQTPPGGGAPTIYQQRFQTTVINGRTLIARNLLNTTVK